MKLSNSDLERAENEDYLQEEADMDEFLRNESEVNELREKNIQLKEVVNNFLDEFEGSIPLWLFEKAEDLAGLYVKP